MLRSKGSEGECRLNWPEHLINQLAMDRWSLFIGSGVAASCSNKASKSPPTWHDLLTYLCDGILDEDTKSTGEELISRYDYLGAADHIRHCYEVEHRVHTYHQRIKEAVTGPLDDPFEPSSLYTVLLSLNPRTVFTTNYDKLFEIASRGGYSSHDFKSATLTDDLRRAEPVLVKLHGSVDSLAEVVLTRRDYSRVHHTGEHVLGILRALALTQTILFVGYSLGDPDIQLVLQNLGHNRLSPEAHFMLAEEPASASTVAVFQECFGVSVLTYPRGDHPAAEVALQELSDEVAGLRATFAP